MLDALQSPTAYGGRVIAKNTRRDEETCARLICLVRNNHTKKKRKEKQLVRVHVFQALHHDSYFSVLHSRYELARIEQGKARQPKRVCDLRKRPSGLAAPARVYHISLDLRWGVRWTYPPAQ